MFKPMQAYKRMIDWVIWFPASEAVCSEVYYYTCSRVFLFCFLGELLSCSVLSILCPEVPM